MKQNRHVFVQKYVSLFPINQEKVIWQREQKIFYSVSLLLLNLDGHVIFNWLIQILTIISLKSFTAQKILKIKWKLNLHLRLAFHHK